MRLTNYYEHRADNRYYVFEFFLAEHADEFQQLLEEKSLTFERFFDAGDTNKHYFGVEKAKLREAMWCNNMVHARHRKPFIPSAFFRWTLLLFTAGMIALAILGYLQKA